MLRAKKKDRDIVVEILSKSFEENRSVNYVIKQDHLKDKRRQRLMEYSFDYCSLFGDVYLSDNKEACALVMRPEKKMTSLKSIWLDLKLAFNTVGITSLSKVMKRESRIKSLHPKEGIIYLWFIGVHPQYQNKGIGSSLLGELVEVSQKSGNPIYLETSTMKNIPWYMKFGFIVYKELDDFGYRLFCLKYGN